MYVVQISISLNSAIFLYTAGPATFEFVLWQVVRGFLLYRVFLWQLLACQRFAQGGISLNSAMKFFHYKANYFRPGSPAWESELLTNY